MKKLNKYVKVSKISPRNLKLRRVFMQPNVLILYMKRIGVQNDIVI